MKIAHEMIEVARFRDVEYDVKVSIREVDYEVIVSEDGAYSTITGQDSKLMHFLQQLNAKDKYVHPTSSR